MAFPPQMHPHNPSTAAKKLYEHYLGKEEKGKWSFNRQSDSGSNYNIGYETR